MQATSAESSGEMTHLYKIPLSHLLIKSRRYSHMCMRVFVRVFVRVSNCERVNGCTKLTHLDFSNNREVRH